MYNYKCDTCGSQEDHLMSYDERKTTFPCECGDVKYYGISPVKFKPGGGGHAKRIIAPDVGPMSKSSRSFEKKMDDENSQFYAPGMHGSMTANQREVFKQRQKQMDTGKTNFTKTDTEVKV